MSDKKILQFKFLTDRGENKSGKTACRNGGKKWT